MRENFKTKAISAFIGLSAILMLSGLIVPTVQASVCFLPNGEDCAEGQTKGFWPGAKPDTSEKCDSSYSSTSASNACGVACEKCTDQSSRYYGLYKCPTGCNRNCDDYTSDDRTNKCGMACEKCLISGDKNFGLYKCPAVPAGGCGQCKSAGYNLKGNDPTVAAFLANKDKCTVNAPFVNCEKCTLETFASDEEALYKCTECDESYSRNIANLSEQEKKLCGPVCGCYAKCGCDVGYHEADGKCVPNTCSSGVPEGTCAEGETFKANGSTFINTNGETVRCGECVADEQTCDHEITDPYDECCMRMVDSRCDMITRFDILIDEPYTYGSTNVPPYGVAPDGYFHLITKSEIYNYESFWEDGLSQRWFIPFMLRNSNDKVLNNGSHGTSDLKYGVGLHPKGLMSAYFSTTPSDSKPIEQLTELPDNYVHDWYSYEYSDDGYYSDDVNFLLYFREDDSHFNWSGNGIEKEGDYNICQKSWDINENWTGEWEDDKYLSWATCTFEHPLKDYDISGAPDGWKNNPNKEKYVIRLSPFELEEQVDESNSCFYEFSIANDQFYYCISLREGPTSAKCPRTLNFTVHNDNVRLDKGGTSPLKDFTLETDGHHEYCYGKARVGYNYYFNTAYGGTSYDYPCVIPSREYYDKEMYYKSPICGATTAGLAFHIQTSHCEKHDKIWICTRTHFYDYHT